MANSNVIIERSGAIATLTLNRPEQMNPLDQRTVESLLAGFRELDADDSVRVILIMGAGRAFSAGGDLEAYLTLYRHPAEFRRFLDDLKTLFERFAKSAKVIIAAVHGYCLAGGLELMLACDLAIAAHDARIGDAHLNFGQLPGAGGSQRLPRAIGAQRARDLMFTGRWIDGTEAERIGLVARVVPAAELIAAANQLARDLLAKSAQGLALAKRLVGEGLNMELERALNFEIDLVHRWASTHPDAIEGLVAFSEKRAPRFAKS